MAKKTLQTYELISKSAKKGISELYQRYGHKLFYYSNKNWGISEDDSWDLVYKTLFHVIKKIKDEKVLFTSEEKFTGFLYKTHTFHLLSKTRDLKKSHKEIYVESQLLESLTSDEAFDDPDNYLLKELNQELDLLEDWERMLLLLRAQQFSYSHIAQFLDKPHDQLKVYYMRLKEKLYQRINSKIHLSNE